MRRPIGVYDSGIGGLTVLKELQKKFPYEDFIYFADTANVPYGPKSPEEIIAFSRNIIEWMVHEMGVKLVVAACHTSSGIALEPLQPYFKIPLIGTMMPVVKAVQANSAHERIGVIATQATTQRKAHETMLRKNGFEGEIISIACPEFVPLIEAGNINDSQLYSYAEEYLMPFKSHNLDTLIYGCTHYPLIAHVIKSILAHDVMCIDPADYIAREVDEYLTAHKEHNTPLRAGKTSFYCSGALADFIPKVEQCMGISIPCVFAEKT